MPPVSNGAVALARRVLAQSPSVRQTIAARSDRRAAPAELYAMLPHANSTLPAFGLVLTIMAWAPLRNDASDTDNVPPT